MRIQTFKNKKGLIHGTDPKRIDCDKSGVLRIGHTEVSIEQGVSAVMPLLFNGTDGNFDATFTDIFGSVYQLEKVAVRGGRIAPLSHMEAEIMDLRCRLDEAEDERDALRARVTKLENIFDTNSLNFLIN